MPAVIQPVTSVTLSDGEKKIEIELEKIDGFRPTFYIDIQEKVSSDGGGVYRSLIMDEETGYVTDVGFDSVYAPHAGITDSNTAAGTGTPTALEMDFMAAVTSERVSEIRHEIEKIFC